MFDRREIRAATEEGVLTPEQARAFENFLQQRSDPDRGLDSENLRFLTNFNDIFLAIGMVILVFGVGAASFFTFLDGEPNKWTIVMMPVPVLMASWALAEYFAGRRRLLLPSMVLVLSICASAAVIGVALMVPDDGPGDIDNAGDMLATIGYVGFGLSAAAAFAAHYRFNLPFALLPFAVSLAGLAYTAIAQAGQGDAVIGGFAALLIGIATLSAAVWFDMKDPLRASLSSDKAFWLHLAAAPQIIFGVRGLVLGSGFAPAGAADSIAMLLVLAAFALLSVALNRRALIVSGLLTFATAIITLLNSISGGDEGRTMMLAALVVGGAIVLLGGGWRTARRALLKAVPTSGTIGRIFPPEPA